MVPMVYYKECYRISLKPLNGQESTYLFWNSAARDMFVSCMIEEGDNVYKPLRCLNEIGVLGAGKETVNMALDVVHFYSRSEQPIIPPSIYVYSVGSSVIASDTIDGICIGCLMQESYIVIDGIKTGAVKTSFSDSSIFVVK